MYTISQAAARSGVSVALLRAWERRYGVVRPTRTAGGYRLYDEPAIARLRAMRRLVDEGWSPSAAASAILDGRVTVEFDVDSGIPDSAGAGEPRQRPANQGRAGGASRSDELARRLVSAAAVLDVAGVDAVLDELFSVGSFERVASELLFPALQRLGDAWASGSLSVAGEHLASNAVLRRLGQALEAAGQRSAGGGRVIVGMPPGARHELGAFAFAVAASRGGLPVTYLGSDLPVEDWVTAAERAAAAVIGVVTARDRKSALEVARELHAARPGLVVAFGGRAAPEDPSTIQLPESLPASVETLGRALAGQPA